MNAAYKGTPLASGFAREATAYDTPHHSFLMDGADFAGGLAACRGATLLPAAKRFA